MLSPPDMPKAGPAAQGWLLSLLIAVVAAAAVIGTLDATGAVGQLGEGPGLTLDETFNVQMGVYHLRAMRTYGLGLLHPASIQEVFGAPGYNPDHPPLGRLLIGLAHDLSRPVLKPELPPDLLVVTCGRVASAFAFAGTVLLIGGVTSRWYGRMAGGIAAVSLLLMPRLFAHAHLAALETSLGLMYAATVLFVADRWTGTRVRGRDMVLAGFLLGLTLLTKIQAVLLPIPIAVWALGRWKLRAILPLVVFGGTGLAVFFVGWPWLWLDPFAHLAEYFGRATNRQTLYCWYAGQKWADTDVPWHYPLVMFGVTVPVGLQLLGILGVLTRHRWHTGPVAPETAIDEAPVAVPRRLTPNPAGIELVLLSVLWPLLFFALPGITMYDGTRLFLMVFPLWGVLIGCGGAALWQWISTRWGRSRAVVALTTLLLLQACGVIAMHPVQLSYYNLLVGGLSGASRLGFEVTYWGDSVTRSIIRDIAADVGESDFPVDVAPVLHPFQLQELQTQSPVLRVPLRAFDDTTGRDVRHVLVFRRCADSWDSLTPRPPDSRRQAAVIRDGVPLTEFYDIAPGTFGDLPPSE